MCDTIDHRRGATGKSILVEFERDASIRATEVLVINQDRDGHERQGVRLICNDNGTMTIGKVNDMQDGVDIVS